MNKQCLLGEVKAHEGFLVTQRAHQLCRSIVVGNMLVCSSAQWPRWRRGSWISEHTQAGV